MIRTLLGVAAVLTSVAPATPSTSHQSPPIAPPPAVEPLTIAQVVEPLTDLVGKAEADNVGGYNAANNGRAMDLGRNGFSRVFGRSTSEVTVGEILLAQGQRRIHAVGRYQIIGITLKSLVKARCISGSQLFTEEVQDEAFVCLIKKNRPAVWRYISTGQGLVSAANGIACEWASMPYTHGRSYYGGSDQAHATRAEVFSALEAARSNYAGRLEQSGAGS
jgi:hypothetical protein